VTWATRFHIRQQLTGSLWVVPLTSAVLGVALSNVSVELERLASVPSGWTYSDGTALTVLTTVAAAAVGLIGFVVTVTVLLVQMATGVFSPRYMRVWYHDRVLKAVLSVLVGTFTFTYSLLRRIEGDELPNLGVSLSGALLAVGIVLFLVFLDRFVRRMRPVKVAALVAEAGRDAFVAMQAERPAASPTGDASVGGEPVASVRSIRSGAMRALDEDGIVSWAAQRGCVVVLTRAPGDFVSRGTVLGHVHAPAFDGDAQDLVGMIALGAERTMEQDPAFALRILSDIASKALSPAINDPTTATQVLDYMEGLLAEVGATAGLSLTRDVLDEHGIVRLRLPDRRFEDYLALGVTEIRQFGATCVQVLRRLRAMLEDLRSVVRPEHVAAVDEELRRLERTVAEAFGGTVDIDRAVVADRQGLGGPPVPWHGP
jgi:uncharacterized membrane protein